MLTLLSAYCIWGEEHLPGATTFGNDQRLAPADSSAFALFALLLLCGVIGGDLAPCVNGWWLLLLHIAKASSCTRS
ncbi:hypothetical protein TNCT_166191 [Trichonephila clavata]|uniref:Uncharacterized protein n=1 Tax=Trichonephila clavata TaxID=2740835 RepID=A0A8X6GHY8_TRICU|nr:hypothetical protein TNCT_166191 [Trichonephila clavata]